MDPDSQKGNMPPAPTSVDTQPTQPIQPAQDPTPQPPVPEDKPLESSSTVEETPKKRDWTKIILLVLIPILFAIMGILGYQNYQLNQKLKTPVATPTPTDTLAPLPTATPDPTAVWQVYSGTDEFTFQYPDSWTKQANYSLQSPDKLMSIWIKGNEIGFPCLTEIKSVSQPIENRNLTLKYYQGVNNENCKNEGDYMIFIPELTTDLSFSFGYTESNRTDAEELLDQILSTFQFLECSQDSDCQERFFCDKSYLCPKGADPLTCTTTGSLTCVQKCESDSDCPSQKKCVEYEHNKGDITDSKNGCR